MNWKKGIPIIVFIIALLIFFPPTGASRGSYNVITGKIKCESPDACLHEYGHAIDKASGWVSKSKDFQKAIEVYRQVAWQCITCRDSYSDEIGFFPGIGSSRIPDKNPFDSSFWEGGWGGYSELYAEIFRWCHGDISKLPAPFQKFYKQEIIHEITDK